MGFLTNFNARKAYMKHVQGNRAFEAGKTEEGREMHKQAMEGYEKAYKEGMNDPNYLMAYSVLLMRAGDFEKSREIMLKLDKMKLAADQRKQLHINYSVLQWKMGNLDKAIEQMRVVAAGGKTAMVYTTLGQYLIDKAIQTGDFTEAIEFNHEAYEYDEEDAGTLDNLGQLKYAMGEREAAKDYFRRALEQKPSQTVTLYNLARLLHEDGEDDEARKLIARAVDGNFSSLCPVSREEVQALQKEIG